MSAKPIVVESVPYNTRMVFPDEPNPDSAIIDVYSGIMDTGKLTQLRERAVYDLNTLSYAPLADSGTGLLFPDSVKVKVDTESALRIRPSTFRGKKQLDVEEIDSHFSRQFHPNSNGTNWFNGDKNSNFVGYPNPNIMYGNMDAIPSQNLQNISQSQLTEALRVGSTGFDHEEYMNRVGSLLRSEEVPFKPVYIPNDGGGVSGDPHRLSRMIDEHEMDFQKAARIRVTEATNDNRYSDDGPASELIKEQARQNLERETQFTRMNEFWGLNSVYDPYISRA
jgi:hypothetical protein